MSNDQYFHPNSVNKIEETVGGYEKQHVSRETASWVVVNVDFIDRVKVQIHFLAEWKLSQEFHLGGEFCEMQELYYRDNLTYLHGVTFHWPQSRHKPSAVSPLIVLTWAILLMHLLHQLFFQTSYCSWFRPSVQRLPIVTHVGCRPSYGCISELGKGWIVPPAAVADPSFINPSFFAITVQSYISATHPWATNRQALS